MFKETQKTLIYIVIVLVPALIFITRSPRFPVVKLAVVKYLAGPADILSFPVKELKKIVYYHRTFQEYKRLRREVATLKARMIGLDEVAQENTRLQRLLQFKRRFVYSSVGANVIGRDPSGWQSTMVIDRGSESGIREGMAVVNALGVVGKVAEVGAESSKVILLTDPYFSVAGLVERSRESGLISGSLQGVCRMRYLSANADVQAGDTVITSKLSTSFPEGLVIGTVIHVIVNPRSSSVECLVEPAATFSLLEEVLVIVSESP